MLKKILVPLDGSDQSGRIVSWAAGLAAGLGSELVLFNVVDPDDVKLPDTDPDHDRVGSMDAGSGPYDNPGRDAGSGAGPDQIPSTAVRGMAPGEHMTGTAAYGTQLVDEATERARRYLMGEADRVAESGAEATVEVSAGKPADEIEKAAGRLEVDAIAMVTRRESTLARGILGSVTDRVLHTTNLPMLVVHADDHGSAPAAGTPGTVIVPLDGSPLSESAIPVAQEIASSVGAKILFLRSSAAARTGVADMGANYIPTTYGLENEQEDNSTYLETFVEAARKTGIEADKLALSGAVARTIVEAAEASHEALIVMSSHGRSGFRRFIFGSVADEVVRTSDTPVLVLPPE